MRYHANVIRFEDFMKRQSDTGKPLFFLFTCVKDGRDYIPRLFDSLIHQNNVNFVHYIYEDGSSEPLGRLVEDYKDKVSRLPKPYEIIYEYHSENIGLTKSTQHCISKCFCPFFIWIDCDNYVDPFFFDELEKLYKKNKNSLLLRTTLYNSSDSKLYYCNAGTIDEANSKYQFGLLLRRRFYYSFFAVNYQKYRNINLNNIMLDRQGFYNDEQVLCLCLLESGYAPLSKTAKGYFLVHEQQESSRFNLPFSDLKKYQIELCKNVNIDLWQKVTTFYTIKELYEQLFVNYKSNFAMSIEIINNIKKISRSSKISLKNYRNYSLIKIFIKTYFWRFKNKWKKK